MIVRGDIKKYIGAVDSEETAAHFYDKYALIIQGFEVHTFYEKSKFSWLFFSYFRKCFYICLCVIPENNFL